MKRVKTAKTQKHEKIVLVLLELAKEHKISRDRLKQILEVSEQNFYNYRDFFTKGTDFCPAILKEYSTDGNQYYRFIDDSFIGNEKNKSELYVWEFVKYVSQYDHFSDQLSNFDQVNDEQWSECRRKFIFDFQFNKVFEDNQLCQSYLSLLRALMGNHYIECNYQSLIDFNAEQVLTLRPLSIIIHNKVIELVAMIHEEGKEHIHSYRLEKIKDVVVLPDVFEYPDLSVWDPHKRLKHQVDFTKDKFDVADILIRNSSIDKLESMESFQIRPVREVQGWYQFNVLYSSADELTKFLSAHADDVVVLGPEKLKSSYEAKLSQAMENQRSLRKKLAA